MIPLAQTNPLQISGIPPIHYRNSHQLCAFICDNIRSAAMQKLEADVLRCLLPWNLLPFELIALIRSFLVNRSATQVECHLETSKNG